MITANAIAWPPQSLLPGSNYAIIFVCGATKKNSMIRKVNRYCTKKRHSPLLLMLQGEGVPHQPREWVVWPGFQSYVASLPKLSVILPGPTT